MNVSFLLLSLLAILSVSPKANASEELLKGKQKILVLGDSITQAGSYVAHFDAWLVKKYPERRITVINAGVSSETVSGLSEPNHAGGRFPRPDLHERLERVLAKTKPDLIIACYGINCGIYQPLDEARFESFRKGILRLREAGEQCGAVVVHLTPPIYDNHGKDGFNYDEVMNAYSKWLVDQRKQGWHVADLHSEMRAKVDRAKQADPKFTVQGDCVHPNAAGHWMMTQTLIAFFGDAESAKLDSPEKMLEPGQINAVNKRMLLYQKAIHAETKPKRPEVPQGGTLESAAAAAKELEAQIYGGTRDE